MSDEHRADVTGYAGNAVVRTPVLDRLAADGTVFTNAYTPAPICVPARQSMMAGQFPRTTGCERYGEDLAPGHMTFARRLAQYGYATVACGKLHHTGPDQMQGWTARVGGDVTVDARHLPDRVVKPTNPIGHKWPIVKEVQRAGAGRGPSAVADEYTVVGAIDYLTRHFVDPFYDRAIPEQPLLLKVSLNEPHYPFLAEDPQRFAYYLPRVPTYAGQQPFDHPFLGGGLRVVAGTDASEREIRRATAAYYAMVESMDARLGRVIDALHHVGQDLDEWIVIYTADHGEMLGEHGVFEKQKFFEGSVRVPLLVRWPAGLGGGRTVRQNVSLCDLFATLCELTGVPAPSGLDSRSLVPLLRGDAHGWDDEAVSQYNGKNLMIKRGALKYQHYGPGLPEVLFDLDMDPGETRNVIDDPQHKDAVELFRRRRRELAFGG
ncbi:sulfatase-like hydrolase/transferase [Nonomuraea sp. K274]|uniref:Sulfatase-like hydrolase/transferase n=2 Tax=Nonomuraea cypriaca TaxID=1187855 RepID=A0A931AND9_9ACTN|nr:sulfatase-like hydrolase/transferase [Nonomuraea cypriaca]